MIGCTEEPMRDHRSPVALLRELRLTHPERSAARAERRVEQEMRRQRDNEWSAERRAAALEAELRRWGNFPSRAPASTRAAKPWR
jgi:hypothetical protein